MTTWHLVETESRIDDRHCTMSYLGVTEGLTHLDPFIADRLHRGAPMSRSQHTVARTELSDLASNAVTDLVIAGVPIALARNLPRSNSIVLPFRIQLVTDFDGDGAHLCPSAKERKRQRRRVSKYRYTYEVSREQADFDWFYDRLHAPTMDARHGAYQRTLPKEIARKQLFDAGFLFFVLSAGERVAGILCHVDQVRRLCNARLVGWLDGDKVHLEREALKTGNHFLLDWARTAKFARVDFQGCEPFTSKGTFQSKRHLGVRVTLPPPPCDQLGAWVKVIRDTPAIRDFLVNNPPIVLDDRTTLRPYYFFDSQRPARWDLGHSCHGMGDPIEINLDNFLIVPSKKHAENPGGRYLHELDKTMQRLAPTPALAAPPL